MLTLKIAAKFYCTLSLKSHVTVRRSMVVLSITLISCDITHSIASHQELKI